MNLRNKLAKQRGFTLVEVIVVAIIVAALAGVAIPMYTSYVTSSRVNAASNAAGSVASFMGSCTNQSGDVPAAPTTESSGASAITLKCIADSSGTDITISSMQLPSGIKFLILAPTATVPGSVRATHVASAVKDSAHYNY